VLMLPWTPTVCCCSVWSWIIFWKNIWKGKETPSLQHIHVFLDPWFAPLHLALSFLTMTIAHKINTSHTFHCIQVNTADACKSVFLFL